MASVQKNPDMNHIERDFRPAGLAELEYLDGEYRIVKPGSYVLCAVSGVQIPLDSLRYWSVDLQEAYATPTLATQRYRDTGRTPR